MNLVDLPRVKAYLDLTSNDNDALLDDLISGVSDQIERYLGRGIELKSRTEVFDLEDYQDRLFLSAFPVTTVTSVKYDITGVFSSGDVSGYYTNKATGVIRLPSSYDEATYAMQVVYTGGLAADVNGLLSGGWADLVNACSMQVAALFKRRQNIEQTSVSDAAGGVSYADLDLLPAVKAILAPYRVVSSS